MTESISTPNALVQTTNGKRFYVNSGVVAVDNTETSVVVIANIGERDIKLKLNPYLTTESADNITIKIKNNGLIIYQTVYRSDAGYGNQTTSHALHFIIPANTSLDITFTNVDSTSHNVGVSCYGRYLSM